VTRVTFLLALRSSDVVSTVINESINESSSTAFDLCVAPTTQKCDWLMLDSDESDDRPKLTGRQDKGNNWIAVN